MELTQCRNWQKLRRLNGVQVVGGSNPLAPTNNTTQKQGVKRKLDSLFFCGLDFGPILDHGALGGATHTGTGSWGIL